jgi:hypothetical protein
MSKLVNITVDITCYTRHVKVKAVLQAEFEIQLDILGSNKYCHNPSPFIILTYTFFNVRKRNDIKTLLI